MKDSDDFLGAGAYGAETLVGDKGEGDDKCEGDAMSSKA